MTVIARIVAVVVAAVGLLVAAGGVSSADDPYKGQTYADASQAIKNSGNTAAIANVVGSQLPTDKCIVTRSVITNYRDTAGKKLSGQIALDLNCNAALASPGKPGNSIASPEGKAALQELKTAEYCASADQQGNKNCEEYCSTRAELCEQGAKNVAAADLKTAEYCASADQEGNPNCKKFCSIRAEICEQGVKNVQAQDLKTAQYCAAPAQAGDANCEKFCSLRAAICKQAANQAAYIGSAGRIVPGTWRSHALSATPVRI